MILLLIASSSCGRLAREARCRYKDALAGWRGEPVGDWTHIHACDRVAHGSLPDSTAQIFDKERRACLLGRSTPLRFLSGLLRSLSVERPPFGPPCDFGFAVTNSEAPAQKACDFGVRPTLAAVIPNGRREFVGFDVAPTLHAASRAG